MFWSIFGLFLKPESAWRDIGARSDKEIKKLLPYPIFMALLPAFAFYYGATVTGWKVIGDNATRMTPESAIPISVLFYVALIGAIVFIGWMIHWMSATYNANSFVIKGIVLMGYASTPIFLTGLFAIYPVWWFDLLLATAACGYAIRLVYLGVPVMMKVPEDRGFLYASAVFLVALVYIVAMLTATAILWEHVATPVFTD